MAIEQVSFEVTRLLLQEGSTAFPAAFFGMWLIMFVVVIGVNLLWWGLIGYGAYWVYNDAESRGENGILWAALVFFSGGPIGILLYFLAGRE